MASLVQIAFVTDVEGNWAWWRQYLELSAVLAEDTDAPALLGDAYPLRLVHESAYFVYGGDVFDKGPGDLRLASQLVALKDRYPHRVTLIIGNRDYNKTRFSSELDVADMTRPLVAIPGPYWFPENGSSPAEFVRSRVVAAGGDADDEAAVARENTAEARLTYLLTFTMGSPATFAYRRAELAAVRGVALAAVTDADVVASYVRESQPDGLVARYLERAQLAALVGRTLVVHGGLSLRSYGFVPDRERNRDARQDEPPGHQLITPGVDDPPGGMHVAAWVNALNEFARCGVRSWLDQPRWDSARETRGGASLAGYFYEPSVCGRSVSVGSFAESGSPEPPVREIVDSLVRGGVERVCSGHKPFSDMPLVMRADGGLEVVIADTSYADPAAADSRGAAVHEVLLEGPALDGPLRTRLRGVRANGVPYDFVANEPVGTRTHDGWWVQAPTDEPAVWVQVRGERRRVHRREAGIPAAE